MTYGYDPRGLLASVTDAAGVGASYSYDAAGRRTGTALGNGMPPSVYAYDNADRLTSITHTYLDAGNVQQQLAIGYTYDNAGNKLTMSDNRATPAGTTTYTYDALDRLTAVVDPASAITSYGYDAAGNRTSVTTGGSTVTSTFDALNRLLGDTSGASYTYDANGNQLTRSAGGVTTTYTYDSLDRMTGLSGGPHSAVYTYNGDGLRISKAVDGGAAAYQTWAAFGIPQPIREGATDYLWSRSGEVVAQVPMGGTAQYAQGDGLGSMRQITDTTGHVVGSQQYDAFGAPQQQTGIQAQPVPGWSIGFTGQQMDAESGLVYLRARYYQADSGRFLSLDPLPGSVYQPASQHRFVYAGNNPLRFVDPRGTQFFCVAEDCGGGGGGSGGGAAVRPRPAAPPAANPSTAAAAARAAANAVVRAQIQDDAEEQASSSEQADGAHAPPVSILDVFDNPDLLDSMTDEEILALIEEARSLGFLVGPLEGGTHRGQGTKITEVNAQGRTTDRSIRFHPGGGRHGPDPYIRVTGGLLPGGTRFYRPGLAVPNSGS